MFSLGLIACITKGKGEKRMVDKKLCKYCPSGDKANITDDGHCICINKAYGGKCKYE